MQFDKNFFDAEYMDGFFVDERMKRFWAASIETLEEIDKVCKNIILHGMRTGGHCWERYGIKGLYRGMMILILQ